MKPTPQCAPGRHRWVEKRNTNPLFKPQFVCAICRYRKEWVK